MFRVHEAYKTLSYFVYLESLIDPLYAWRINAKIMINC